MNAALVFSSLGFSALGLLLLFMLALLLSAYVKIATVLSIVRLGFGIDSLPSAFITGGLSLGLALLVMYPTLESSSLAIEKVLKQQAGEVPTANLKVLALSAGVEEWKRFLQVHADTDEVKRFSEVATRLAAKTAGKSTPEASEVSSSLRVLAPAFLVSELKEAFATGLSLFLPFLVVELLCGITLAALGMDRLDPSLVSLPFKLLLFVMVDGWSLITSNLVATYF